MFFSSRPLLSSKEVGWSGIDSFMEANKDEAFHCRDLGAEAFRNGNIDRAERLLNKSLRLYPCDETRGVLRLILAAKKKQAQDSNSQTTSPPPTSESKTGVRSSPQPPPERPYTEEHVAHVKRVLSAKDYYEVLQVERTADEAIIKKMYRKLALTVHPDRNPAPGANDAFKKVGAAFQCLSDSHKRADYDMFGREEGTRVSHAEARARAYQHYYSRQRFSEDEDLFDVINRMFQHQHAYGQHRHAYRRYARSEQHHHSTSPPPNWAAYLIQLLPLLLLLFGSWIAMRGSQPSFTFEKGGSFVHEFKTEKDGIVYYVQDGTAHAKDMKHEKTRKTFEQEVISGYIQRLRYMCNDEQLAKQRAIQGVRMYYWRNQAEELAKAQQIPTPSCEKLRGLYSAARA